MNRAISLRLATALALLVSAILITGCGKKSDTTAGIVAPVTGPTGTLTGGGCMPLASSVIPFTGTNIYYSGISLVGGLLPGVSQQVGQVVLGGGATSGMFFRQGGDGQIVMSVVQSPSLYNGNYPSGYPNNIYSGSIPSNYPVSYGSWSGSSYLATVTGSVTLSQAVIQDILNNAMMGSYGAIPGLTNQTVGTGTGYGYGNGYGYGGYNMNYQQMASLVCVSGVAFNGLVYGNTLYGMYVYLYLNNTAHGYTLYF
jgi:hypothetical protein